MSLVSNVHTLVHPLLRRLSFSLPVSSGNKKIKVPIIHGTGLGVYNQVRRGEEFWKLDLFGKLLAQRNGIFVDVGANLGQTLIQLRQVDDEYAYLGFEPNPECLNFINRLIDLNGYRNCDLLACGLGEKSGILSLYLPQGRATDSTATLIKNLRPERDYDVRHVPIFNEEHLQDFLADRTFGVVKIDVEGAELEVMKGFRNKIRRDRPPILCEVLFTDPKGSLDESRTRNEQLAELLNDLGYNVWQIHKTQDGQGIENLQKINAFENAYYMPGNAALCDYLFLPDESAGKILLDLAKKDKP
jgi:FkbM family methyltransferase